MKSRPAISVYLEPLHTGLWGFDRVAMSSPPYYVLLSHATLSSSSSHATVSTTPTLTHPTIQYQFRDDPPLSFPDAHNAHVLVMDYDPTSPDLVQVQSLSPQLAVTSLKVNDAPGAGSMPEDDEQKNNKMYVLETVAHPPADKGLVTLTLKLPLGISP